MTVQTDYPLFEAVDCALLEVVGKYPQLAGLAELWFSLEHRERVCFEESLKRQLGIQSNSERVRTLSEVLTYHHAAALYYAQMSERFADTQPKYNLGDVNRLVANHEKQRGADIMAVIRRGGEGDVSHLLGKRF